MFWRYLNDHAASGIRPVPPEHYHLFPRVCKRFSSKAVLDLHYKCCITNIARLEIIQRRLQETLHIVICGCPPTPHCPPQSAHRPDGSQFLVDATAHSLLLSQHPLASSMGQYFFRRRRSKLFFLEVQTCKTCVETPVKEKPHKLPGYRVKWFSAACFVTAS